MQSTTILAVLAGYTVLVVLTVSLNRIERRQAHQQLIDRISAALIQRVRRSDQFTPVVRQMLLPDLAVKLLATGSEFEPRLQWHDEGVFMESASPLMLRDGQQRALLLRQDVTDSIAQQNLALQLLAAAAGASAMLTGLLLRPVMTYGLVQPLEALSQQISSYRSPSEPPPPLDVASQPEELQPIAATFNAMQERLASSWERQRTFVDGVAHELRTPITLISGHAQSLLRQPAAAALGPSLALISAEARRMGGMVSDMLDLARKDAGRLELRRQPIDVEDIMLECFERLAAGADGRLRLQPPQDERALPLAAGDPERLAQCLVVLVDNALRYSPCPSPVRLAVQAKRASLVLHVLDCGPGVAPAEREAIFGRFVRGQAAVNTRGSGIGLAVVQLLMEAMGGIVMVSDAPGGGADFQLHLPLLDDVEGSEPQEPVTE
ncbi:MAG: HAMP domain-containing sensor histidine kinase [Cyanobium sp.]